MERNSNWIEQALAEEWLRGPEEAHPHIPEAALLDEPGAVGPEINPRRREAPRKDGKYDSD